MANVKISALPAVSTVVPGTDVLPLVSGGITTKATPTQIVSAALNNPQVISVNSASDALRITQVGAGNAFLVEDSTNPDSTPFVIDQSGNIVSGNTTTFSTALSIAPQFSLGNIGNGSGAGITIAKFRNAASFGPDFEFTKSRASAIGVNALVSGTDLLGTITFSGADGTGYIQAASIAGWTDGTPGTNDMPGRLVFSTTKDGASSPTEAMRIDSGQRIGIGTTPSAGINFRIGSSLTGATTAIASSILSTVQSDVTATAIGYISRIGTAATSFTVGTLNSFRAEQATIGAGSAVTNQYGYFADASLTGATNNFGFYSNIASGTGRYNFYANGTAANYFAGDLTIYGGTAVPAGGTAGVGYKFSSTSNLGVFFGSGAPTLAAAQGSLYVRTDGSSTSTRLYVNTNGSTTWTNVVTAA